jgi:hypothetical protein
MLLADVSYLQSKGTGLYLDGDLIIIKELYF